MSLLKTEKSELKVYKFTDNKLIEECIVDVCDKLTTQKLKFLEKYVVNEDVLVSLVTKAKDINILDKFQNQNL